MNARPVRTLLFSTLFPSAARPIHGIFVETRLRELLASGGAQTKVLAPVPWFPSTNERWGDYARMARTPARETRHGVEVLHPRYLVVPKIGMALVPLTLALASLGPARRLIREGWDFDLIDAHYYYPDGVAATLLARWLGKPVTITARGTDLNLIPQHALPRRMIQWAARNADASIGVCQALVDVLAGWHIDPAKLHVMRNGVDLQRFRPLPVEPSRKALALEGGPVLLSVGQLIERKGHHLVIDALAELSPQHPRAQLIVVGAGEEQANLEARAAERGVADRVRFTGAVPNEQLAIYYSAADALVLASSREGWANVLLESMACGTPVVATNIWGTPEVVGASAGVLVDERSGPAIAAAAARLLAAPPARDDVRRHAEGFSWQATTDAQLELFRDLRSRRAPAAA